MKKKKKSKKKPAPSNKFTETSPQNSSPVCYANNKDLREGYKEEN